MNMMTVTMVRPMMMILTLTSMILMAMTMPLLLAMKIVVLKMISSGGRVPGTFPELLGQFFV
jgi:hypothetical protein